MPQCQQCNAGLPPGAKFCGRCGAAVATPLDTGLTMPVAATPEPAPAAPPAQDWRSGSGLGDPVRSREEPTRAFGGPPQSPGGPAQGLTDPGQGAGSATQSVGSPAQGFADPGQGMGRHAQGAADPVPGLGAPAQGLGGPAQAFGSPAQNLGTPGPGLGSPAQGLGSPRSGLGGPAQGLGSPGPGLGGQPQGLGGLGFSGTAAGAAGPAQWQITPAAPARPVPQFPSQQGSASGPAIAGGVIAFLGAIGVVVACAVPLIKGPTGAGLGSTSGSLFNLVSHGPLGLKLFLAEPIGVAIISVVAGLVIMANRSRAAPAVAAGVLIGIGIQTTALFFAINYVVSWIVGRIVSGFGSLSGLGSTPALALGIQAGPAGIVGLLGGVLLIVAGIVAGLAAARRA